MDERERRLDPERAGDHIDRLYRAAWALCGNREEAEDLVQETYSRVLARPRFLRKDDDLGYLLRSLRNTFLRQLRTKKRQVRGDEVSAESDPIDLRGYMRPDSEAEAREVFGAIAELPEDFRLTLVAVDVAGLSHEEAAKALGIPAGTVRSRLFRARERVAATLLGEQKDQPGTPAPGGSLSSY
jgi:RNA polymerase sigma-70 factor, ECF subfamily